MDYAHPRRADRLAAEYVLGTLRGPARRRFEALLAAHPALRRATQDWEHRLMPLAADVPQQQPSQGVWLAIERRLFGAPAAGGSRPPWWQRLVPWQTLAGVSLVAAMALAVLLALPAPQPAPWVVVLSADQGPATFVAGVSADGKSLVLKPLAGVTLEPQRVLELWALPSQGAPRSLGVVAADSPTTVRRDRLVEGVSAFAVSVEPPGGSPTGQPTGPVVSVGKLTL